MSHYSKKIFEQVFNKHYNALCNYAYSYLNNHDTAEDAVQEVFLHLWRKRDALPQLSEITPYLFKSVRNKALEIIRKSNNESLKLMNMAQEKDEAINSDTEENSKKYMQMERLNNLIRQLPPKCRDIFVLSKIEGLTYDEIAELKKISKKTVENHMVNAFKNLRKSINS